ncbi:hypothetical protein, partial [Streptomyces sp. UNOB3_S3]|uniref:hypothetical protein n=1 Tax=Streptomyces sp. UNOB3_S3 TaxID=2871682 RepID=UPI001E2E24F9
DGIHMAGAGWYADVDARVAVERRCGAGWAVMDMIRRERVLASVGYRQADGVHNGGDVGYGLQIGEADGSETVAQGAVIRLLRSGA